MRKLITEFIGTFFLVLTVGMVVTGGKGDFAPIAIGSVLMCMIFAGAHVSGAHYNPAVTFAVLLRRRISTGEAIPYMIVQIAGAIAASYMVMFLMADKIPETATTVPTLANTTNALIAEVLGTFALAYVVLNVATAKGTIGNMFYGLAIGFTVLSMAYALGGISNGAFNPAVAIGISLMKIVSWSNIWVYLIGCFGGAALAAIVFRINNPEDR
jgi:aquaporin Z